MTRFTDLIRSAEVSELSPMQLNNHQDKIYTPSKTTDVIADTVVEKMFYTNYCSGSSRTWYCFLLIWNISHEF